VHRPALVLYRTHELLYAATNTKIEHFSRDEALRELRRFPRDAAALRCSGGGTQYA
jgi:hypothetical protein